MWESDIICPVCGAGYRRITLFTCEGTEYRCLTCDHVLDVFDGSFGVLIRLTVSPLTHILNTPATRKSRRTRRARRCARRSGTSSAPGPLHGVASDPLVLRSPRSPTGQQDDGKHSQAENDGGDPGNFDVGNPS